MKNFETPTDALQDLRQRGYEADFDLQSNCLYCSTLDLRLYEEEFSVDEVYHFTGSSKPDESETTITNNSCDITRKLQRHLAAAGLNNRPIK